MLAFRLHIDAAAQVFSHFLLWSWPWSAYVVFGVHQPGCEPKRCLMCRTWELHYGYSGLGGTGRGTMRCPPHSA